MTGVIGAPMPDPGLGYQLGNVLGAMYVSLCDGNQHPLHWPAAGIRRFRYVKIEFLHPRGSNNVGVAVDVQSDEVTGEIGEEDADLRVLQQVAEARHDAVATVLGVGDGVVVENPDETSG